MRKSVDAIIIITNERIKQLYGDMKISQAFSQADTVLATAAKGIAELITLTGYINVDMNDVRTVLTNSGDAIMGSAIASGEGRAIQAIQNALESPLLTNNDISKSGNVLLNISSGVDEYEADMSEISEITEYLQQKLRKGAQIIWGCNTSEELGENLQVTIVVTGLHLTDDELKETKASTKPASKPANGSFMDKLFNMSPKEPEKKPATNFDREPEKLTDEQKSKLSNAFYGCDVFNKEQTKPAEPVKQQPVTPTATVAPVQQPAVEPEEPKPVKPAPKRCSLDDLFNDNSLDDMERSSNPKKNDSDDSIQTFTLQ
jgi:hypothetical protein